MRRHRGGAPEREDISSSEEEDAFSSLSRKQSKRAKTKTEPGDVKPADETADDMLQPSARPTNQAPLPLTSSLKRHHLVASDARKAKMDALLEELQASKHKVATSSQGQPRSSATKGSFVEPGQEHLTTNIFVGNLAPSITEEELTDLFRQFGDLYSVKIMWPRNREERARNRLTGFVCFMDRPDAEDAMNSCHDADPFNTGRRIQLGWGKVVDRVGEPAALSQSTKTNANAPSVAVPSNEDKIVRVSLPSNLDRIRIITTVASFVAKDGVALEQHLLQREVNNPNFDFLKWNPTGTVEQRHNHIFYRWRVHAFCQGDGFYSWNTEPFIMLQGGCVWIPPPPDEVAARQERDADRARDDWIHRSKEQRRLHNAGRDYMTGRQLEQKTRKGVDGTAFLEPAELQQMVLLLRERLSASREAICEAMAFCFEKSGSAKQIVSYLKQLLEEGWPVVGIETRVARLYLVSDILFNSQQPGVRNAWLYRDAIERMIPDVFASLGMHGEGQLGRMTFKKLASAVHSVLDAWAEWNVYNPVFLDELLARFEGREIVKPVDEISETVVGDVTDKTCERGEDAESKPAVRQVVQGQWSSVNVDEEVRGTGEVVSVSHRRSTQSAKEDETPLGRKDDGLDGDPLGEDVDGGMLDEDVDGERLDEIGDDTDGAPMDDDLDGSPVEEDDIDGSPL